MGKPIPDSIHNAGTKSAYGKGLMLPRGPDPRSYDAANIQIMRECELFLVSREV